jgi:hypothetical protein
MRIGFDGKAAQRRAQDRSEGGGDDSRADEERPPPCRAPALAIVDRAETRASARHCARNPSVLSVARTIRQERGHTKMRTRVPLSDGCAGRGRYETGPRLPAAGDPVAPGCNAAPAYRHAARGSKGIASSAGETAGLPRPAVQRGLHKTLSDRAAPSLRRFQSPPRLRQGPVAPMAGTDRRDTRAGIRGYVRPRATTPASYAAPRSNATSIRRDMIRFLSPLKSAMGKSSVRSKTRRTR